MSCINFLGDAVKVSTKASRLLAVDQQIRKNFTADPLSAPPGASVSSRMKIDVGEGKFTNVKDNHSALTVTLNVFYSKIRLHQRCCTILAQTIVRYDVE